VQEFQAFRNHFQKGCRQHEAGTEGQESISGIHDAIRS
jgi:hypothetical protein